MHSHVTGLSFAALACAIAGCQSPGQIDAPLGRFDVRTALYRVSPDDLSILLSNGIFSCGLPSEEVQEEIEAFQLAACREGAQTVILRLYSLPDLPIGGTYMGAERGNGVLSDTIPRTANASYYGVQEAILAVYHDLYRFYLAQEDVKLELIGDGGHVGIALDDHGTIDGWLDIPDSMGSAISGTFRATECTGDDSLIDTLGDKPEFYCELPDTL